MKMKREVDNSGYSWNPFPPLLGNFWNFFGAESKQDHDRFQENQNIEILELQD